ncbi:MULTISPECIES: cytochrome-c peroxidase [Myroides]|uniref:C-type cytochrome n=1 Tax=Myroides albus TaxID=2562892 RepID=A0A6I3LGZ7_9FLAO|nr:MULTISPECIES: cytochrome-c peroxidase [Myroides]MTG98839.1 c-type cytochrome [Myroides albus]MVX34514.1 c-type cytochrome [Myroides sp. LoEW2-1]UVD80464.1 cytochrome-c peroxidase [Myroides albus]
MKKVLALAVLCSFVACKKTTTTQENTESNNIESELLTKAKTFFQPISSVEYEKLDDNKVALGKYLYFDTRLSGEGNISCNSCHNLETFGVDNKAFSPGDDGSLGGRNSPTVFHASLHKMQFWDGRAKDVEEQAGGPILNPVEHNIKSEKQLIDRIKKIEMYQKMFAEVYQGEADPITFENLTGAIGAFERTLNPESRFDKFLEGDDKALTAQEKKGLEEFISTGCITCHNGVALGGQMFQKFGVYGDYWELTKSKNIDAGLYDLSKKEGEKYMFKVPGLRNIQHTSPYFHDGSIVDLKEAVRIMGKLQSNKELTDEQVNDITAFLESLSCDIEDEVKKSPFEEKVG